MGKKEKLVLAGTALATAVTSIFGGGSERANATEHINPPRPPADHQLNNFENPDPSQVEFPATQAKNSQAQTSPSLPRLEQEQQVEVVHIADLNEVVLSDEDFQALLPLWQEAFPESDPTAELEQGGVSELPVSFTSKSLDSLPANVSERVLKIRTRLNDIISQSASESEIQDIFELNLAFYLKNNEVRLIVSARNTINLADELNAGSIVFIDSIGNLRYIEPAEGEQAGFLKADKQTADEASQGYGTMPDGLPAQFIVPEGAVVLTTYIDDEGQERVRVTALLVEGTALGFHPGEEQVGQNIAQITTPAPIQRAPGHAREVVASGNWSIKEVIETGDLDLPLSRELQAYYEERSAESSPYLVGIIPGTSIVFDVADIEEQLWRVREILLPQLPIPTITLPVGFQVVVSTENEKQAYRENILPLFRRGAIENQTGTQVFNTETLSWESLNISEDSVPPTIVAFHPVANMEQELSEMGVSDRQHIVSSRKTKDVYMLKTLVGGVLKIDMYVGDFDFQGSFPQILMAATRVAWNGSPEIDPFFEPNSRFKIRDKNLLDVEYAYILITEDIELATQWLGSDAFATAHPPLTNE